MSLRLTTKTLEDKAETIRDTMHRNTDQLLNLRQRTHTATRQHVFKSFFLLRDVIFSINARFNHSVVFYTQEIELDSSVKRAQVACSKQQYDYGRFRNKKRNKNRSVLQRSLIASTFYLHIYVCATY